MIGRHVVRQSRLAKAGGFAMLLVTLVFASILAFAFGSSARAQVLVSPCEPPLTEAHAFPSTILLGDEIKVQLSTKGGCQRNEKHPLDIAVAIDVSGSMDVRDINQMKRTVEDLVESLDLDSHPNTRIAILSFAEQANVICRLSNDEKNLTTSCLNQVQSQFGRGTNIRAGVQQAQNELQRGWQGQGFRAKQGIVLLSDGGDPNCGSVKTPRRTHFVSVCTTVDCNTVCMRDLASDTSYFREPGRIARLANIFYPLQSTLIGVIPDEIRITDTLPVGFSFIEGSDDPPARVMTGHNEQVTLIWSLKPDRRTWNQEKVVSFNARPSRLGTQPVHVRADVSFKDDLGLTVHNSFPVPYVSVLGSFTPTPQALPSNTPEPDPPTAEPTPTTAARIYHVWFPTLLKGRWHDPTTGFGDPIWPELR